jgi:hypothetical protein
MKCLIPLEIMPKTEIDNPRANSPPKTKFPSTYLFISSFFSRTRKLFDVLDRKVLDTCPICRRPFRSFVADFDKIQDTPWPRGRHDNVETLREGWSGDSQGISIYRRVHGVLVLRCCVSSVGSLMVSRGSHSRIANAERLI